MWKALKDALITSDKPADEKPVGHVPPKDAPPAPQARTAPAQPPVTVDANVTGVVSLNVDAVEKEIDDLIQADTHFAPYRAFMEVADDIQKVISEEGLRYKTAQATTKVDAKALVQGVKDAYTTVLDERQHSFETNYCASEASEIDNIGHQVEDLSTQIHDLTEQLGKLSEQKSALTKSASTKASDLAKAKIDFASVCKTIETRYEEVMGKIQQYLGA